MMNLPGPTLTQASTVGRDILRRPTEPASEPATAWASSAVAEDLDGRLVHRHSST
jgi:hypothetical protein